MLIYLCSVGGDSKKRYKISLTLALAFDLPTSAESWKIVSEQTLRALDSVTLHYSKKGITELSPSWLTVGANSFFRSAGEQFPLSRGYNAMRGI